MSFFIALTKKNKNDRVKFTKKSCYAIFFPEWRLFCRVALFLLSCAFFVERATFLLDAPFLLSRAFYLTRAFLSRLARRAN